MKKRIALLLAALMIASLISVPVMAAEANLAGTWYAQSMEMDGTADMLSALYMLWVQEYTGR